MSEVAKIVGFKDLMRARAEREKNELLLVAENVDAHKMKSVGVQAKKTDAHTIVTVDAKTPTKQKRGRPQNKNVDAHKTERHSKSRGRISLRPEAAILKKFKEFCVKNEIDMQDFFELAGVHYIRNVDAHNVEIVDAKTPTDDRRLKIIYKSSSSIINLYAKYNEKNSWKPMDDREAERFNNVDLRLIEAGIIITQFNAGFKRVHSFKYYVSEIENLIAANISTETLDIMLENYRRNWENAKSTVSRDSEQRAAVSDKNS